MLIFLVLVFTVLYLVYSWISLMKDRRKVNVPGPVPLPILGNGHLLVGDGADFLRILWRMQQKYGNTFLLYVLSQRYVFLTHPEQIEPIVSSTDFSFKGISYYFLQPWLGLGLLTASGHRWKVHRKFLTPAFHFNILQNFLPVFCKNTKILLEKLGKYADGRTKVDLFPMIALDALDNVTEAIMGVSVNAQKDNESEYVKAIEQLSTIVSSRMRNPMMRDTLFNLLPHKSRQDRALKVLHGQTRKVIEARKTELERSNITSLGSNSDIGTKNKHAFLDLLLLTEVDGVRIDDEKVREEVDTFMFEGHDTTTSGIVFSLYCLSKHTDVQEKILNELHSILGDNVDRDLQYRELQQLKYLEAVIKESMRLYPSVPLIERMITEDTEVAGLQLPKNTSVIIDIIHMQRRADLYKDPLEFNPERFLNRENKNPFTWLAFSAGPRNCIGQKFAMMEMKVTLAAIVNKFKILPTESEPELSADLILRAKNGVHVIFEPRISE